MLIFHCAIPCLVGTAAAFLNQPWQIPPHVEVNIKPLGWEVGDDLSEYNLWLQYKLVSNIDSENIDKIADLSSEIDFT